MVKKPNQPAETAEIKKQIETIVGHEIDPGVERLIKFYYPAGPMLSLGWTSRLKPAGGVFIRFLERTVL
jgi:hypothetical protein